MRSSGWTRTAPTNASYSLVGAFTVEDQAGNILAGYTPTQDAAASPFGDARTATIRFAIPLRFLGTPDGHWRFTVLSGGQDDHGGAGIGEFRSVQANGANGMAAAVCTMVMQTSMIC